MTIRTTARNTTAIARALQNGESFTTSGALKGEAYPSWVGTGRMERDETNDMYATQNVLGIDYVVYSYGTPIAYRAEDTGEWTVPDAKYSVTTSKHQSTIRYAVSLAQ